MRFSRNMAGVTAVSLVLLIGLLSGLAGFIPGGWQSAEASVEEKKLLASDAASGDRFGKSVAADGDTAVVGARLEDTKGSDAGAAYVFDRDDGGADNWGEVKQLFASNAGVDDDFGRSVAVDGDTAVVGAMREDTEGSNAGAAYVFGRDEGGTDNWGQVTMLTASDAAADDQFGFSVAVDGDTVVVAANGENNEAGAAYVFDRDEGGTDNWGQVKKLTASDAAADDQFGYSVAADGDTVVVGAFFEDTGGDDAGAAYVFGRNEGGSDNWGEEQKIVASDAEEYDLFGWSVAVDGDIAVVGAIYEAVVGEDGGAAYIFGRDEGGAGNWGELKKITASDASDKDQFGTGVAVSGNTIVVGANMAGTSGDEPGAAYVFARNEGGLGNWGEADALAASDAGDRDWFGIGVALSGDTAFVGASQEDEKGSQAGAAYIFEIPPDADGDAFTDAIEAFVGTDSTDACANTSTANDETDDRWPPDTDDNQIVNTLDVAPFVPLLNSTAPGPPYIVRLDLNANGTINTLDVALVQPFLNDSC